MFLPVSTIALSMCAGSARGNSTLPIEPIGILDISVNPELNQVTLRWSSKTKRLYTIEESTDLQEGWVRNLSGVVGGTNETTITISPIHDQNRSGAMFFRVLEIPQEIIEPTDTRLTSEKSNPQLTPSLDPQRHTAEKSDQEQAQLHKELPSEKSETQGFQPTVYFPQNLLVG